MNLRKIGFLNLLLVFVPIAIAMHYRHAPATWIFAASAVAIIPLAGLMGKSTEMLSERLGPGIGGLLNASFGNAAELIIAIFALKRGLIDVVKASITGSILGNLLLVLGASFLAGGTRYSSQKFNVTAAGISASLLVIAVVGLIVPAAFHHHLTIEHQHADELGLSLEIAIVLFSVYMLMLFFSLFTHKHLYSALPEDSQTGFSQSAATHDHWPAWLATTVLLAATVAVGFMSELLIGAVEETSHQLGWTQLFVGIVVIAIIGNAAEHSTAILVALKNQMDLAFQIAVGSGLQIALFVAPVLVFCGYIPGFRQPGGPQMDLVFSMLEIMAVTIAAIIVALVASDGESNWMEGLLLLAVYIILGIAFYHVPASPEMAPAH